MIKEKKVISTKEKKVQELDNLVSTSKKKGFVTYDELNKSIPASKKLSVDELENAISKFSEAGIDIIEEDDEDHYFGVSNRYSKRIRIPRLNHLAGERMTYNLVKDPVLKINIPTLIGVATNDAFSRYASTHQVSKPKKRRLVKSLKNIKEEENDDEDDDDLPTGFEQENLSEKEEDIVMIPPRMQKGTCKNFQVGLRGEILNSKGRNKFVVGQDVFRNLKSGQIFFVAPDADFNFLNYSDEPLRIKLIILDDII